MDEGAENLMTVAEFNQRVKSWSLVIKDQARGTLSQTNATGKLSARLQNFVDTLSSNDPAYKVKFAFLRYGVFRAYGAGRGYVVVNGIPVRGYRVRSNKDIANHIFGTQADVMRKKGYTTSEINRTKRISENSMSVQRTALNWIDQHIDANINTLADLVANYYGDRAMTNVLKNFDKIKIVK